MIPKGLGFLGHSLPYAEENLLIEVGMESLGNPLPSAELHLVVTADDVAVLVASVLVPLIPRWDRPHPCVLRLHDVQRVRLRVQSPNLRLDIQARRLELPAQRLDTLGLLDLKPLNGAAVVGDELLDLLPHPTGSSRQVLKLDIQDLDGANILDGCAAGRLPLQLQMPLHTVHPLLTRWAAQPSQELDELLDGHAAV